MNYVAQLVFFAIKKEKCIIEQCLRRSLKMFGNALLNGRVVR